MIPVNNINRKCSSYPIATLPLKPHNNDTSSHYLTENLGYCQSDTKVSVRLRANNHLQLVIHKQPYTPKSRRRSGLDNQTIRLKEKKTVNRLESQRIDRVLEMADLLGASAVPLDELPKNSNYKSITDYYIDTVPTEVLKAESQRLVNLQGFRTKSKSHSRWGQKQRPKRMTHYCRQSLQEAGTVIDRSWKDKSYFVTTTLPGSTVAAVNAIADWSGWIVDRQMNLIRKQPDQENYFVYFVWEFQERGALHQHWCVGHKFDTAKAEVMSHKIKDMWFKCLLELQSKSGVDCFAKAQGGSWRNSPKIWRSDVQKVSKSVARYLAKYAGKSSKAVKRLSRRKASEIRYPSSWWGQTRNLHQEVKKYRATIKLEVGQNSVAEVVNDFIKTVTDAYKPVIATGFKPFEISSSFRITQEVKRTDDVTGEISTDVLDAISGNALYCQGHIASFYFDFDQYPEIFESIKEFAKSINSAFGTPKQADYPFVPIAS